LLLGFHLGGDVSPPTRRCLSPLHTIKLPGLQDLAPVMPLALSTTR